MQPYKTLFQYDHWAFSRLYNSYKDLDVADERIERLLTHILFALEIWMARLSGSPIPRYVEFLPMEEIWRRFDQVHQQFQELIHSELDFFRAIDYKDLKGNSHTSSLWEVLTHLVNHGNYHRGQIALRMRENEHAPPATDFIVFARM